MGGWASTKTQKTILTASSVEKTILAVKKFEKELNEWTDSSGSYSIKFIKPLGSSAHYKKDLEDNPEYVYGDIDYLVSFPLLAMSGLYKSKRELENKSIGLYKTLMLNFIEQKSTNVDIEDTLKGNGNWIILEIEPNSYVQIDIIATTPEFVKWNIGRYTPERGLKGFSYGYLYSTINDLYKINVSDRGVLVRIKDKKLVPGTFRKDVVIKTISTNYSHFWTDLLKWSKEYIKPSVFSPDSIHEPVQYHNLLIKYPGIKDRYNPTFGQILTGLKGFIHSLHMSGLLGSDVFPEQTPAEMMTRIKNRYHEMIDEMLDNPKYLKSETEESENMIKMIKEHGKRAKKIIDTYL